MKRLIAILLLLCFGLTACATEGGESSTPVSDEITDATTTGVADTTTGVSSDTTAATGGATTTAGQTGAQGGQNTAAPKTTTTKAPVKTEVYDKTVTVDFAQYDMGNDADSLNLAIDSINTMGAVASIKGEHNRYVLKLPKRRYEFNEVIRLNGIQDFTLDGNGSTFIITENISAFLITGCKNVKLTNFTVDYDPLRYTQGVIKAINGNKLTIEIDAGYPYDVDFINCGSQTHDDVYNLGDSVFTANVYDLSTGAIKTNSAGNYVLKNDAVSKGGRVVEISLHSNSTWQTPSGGMAVGDGIAFSYVGNKMLWAEQCKGGMEFTNITVWGTSGCGMWELNGEGGSLYKNVKVVPGPKPKGATRERFVSCNGDFLHQNANKKGPIIDGCTFTHMMDDVINIHGLVYYVLSSEGNTTYLAPRWDYPFYVGETIKGYDAANIFDKTGELKVTAIESYKDSSNKEKVETLYKYCDKQWGDKTLVYKVTTNKPSNLKFGDFVVSTDRTGAGTIIRNSTFGKNRSRGIVVKTDDVLIENNTITQTNFAAITLQFDNSFGESGYTNKAVIRNNTITLGASSMDMHMFNEYHLGAIMIGHQMDMAHDGYLNCFEFKNILIENNTIKSTGVYGISCVSVDGLTIRNNKIIDPFMFGMGTSNEYRTDFELNPNAGIHIGQCKNVTVTGNTVTGGPKEITEAVQFGKNVSNIKDASGNKKN
ncbi:MAG: right-handed parallel beta-helix repeat-containing protein [Clostridia bacterium]|nr:right-handed parallel beta-helix repeat-containing protein [Clostridia bacterium]